MIYALRFACTLHHSVCYCWSCVFIGGKDKQECNAPFQDSPPTGCAEIWKRIRLQGLKSCRDLKGGFISLEKIHCSRDTRGLDVVHAMSY